MFKYNELKLVNIIATSIVILFSLCGFGCAGDHIEYTTLDHALVGKKIHFKEPMVYVIFSDRKSAQNYGFIYPRFHNKKIIHELVSQYSANDIKEYFPNLPVKSIPKNMTFTIVGSYWQKGDWLRREFAPDIHSIILRDQNDILSVYMVSGDDVQDSLILNTDFEEN